MTDPLRILYVGPLWAGGTCGQRMKALRDLGHYVLGIDTETPRIRSANASLRQRVRCKLFRLGCDAFGPKDHGGVNSAILQCFETKNWDIVWIDKGLIIEAETLRRIRNNSPNSLIVGYSPDDMYARRNQSRQFLQHLPLYHVYLTTKSYGAEELRKLGCHRVLVVGNGFDPTIHKPMPVSSEDRAAFGGPVGFIGDYEPQRAASMHGLASKGIRVRVWGPNWNRRWLKNKNLMLEGQSLWGDQYALALCAFDINLCFLRKCNRDLRTQRSFEIPACGAFMLAERTLEHMALFKEGEEADFFSNDEELLRKVSYYLGNDQLRSRVAESGYQRCKKSGYSNMDIMTRALLEIAPGR